MDILTTIQDIVDHSASEQDAIENVRDYLEEKNDRMTSREYAKQMIARAEQARERA